MALTWWIEAWNGRVLRDSDELSTGLPSPRWLWCGHHPGPT